MMQIKYFTVLQKILSSPELGQKIIVNQRKAI